MGKLTLTDKQLLQAYDQAKSLNLDKEFVDMLKKEVELRNLSEKSKNT